MNSPEESCDECAPVKTVRRILTLRLRWSRPWTISSARHIGVELRRFKRSNPNSVRKSEFSDWTKIESERVISSSRNIGFGTIKDLAPGSSLLPNPRWQPVAGGTTKTNWSAFCPFFSFFVVPLLSFPKPLKFLQFRFCLALE